MGVDEPYDVPTDVWIKKYGVNIMYVNDKNYKYALFKNRTKKCSSICYSRGPSRIGGLQPK